MELSDHLFWDTRKENVDLEKHARKIIERVVTRGRFEDWKAITRYYGLERIKEEALQIRYLDEVSLAFLSTILETPQSEFRCYKEQQLMKGLSAY
jgi:hypothetical protein